MLPPIPSTSPGRSANEIAVGARPGSDRPDAGQAVQTCSPGHADLQLATASLLLGHTDQRPGTLSSPRGMHQKSMSNPRVGDRVLIGRDEIKHPSRGTWPQFRCRVRCRVGTVVEVNLGEYGISFGKVTIRRSRPSTSDWKSNDVAWFQPHEVRLLGQRAAAQPPDARRGTNTGHPV